MVVIVNGSLHICTDAAIKLHRRPMEWVMVVAVDSDTSLAPYSTLANLGGHSCIYTVRRNASP